MKKLLIILIFILLPQIAFAGVLGSFRPMSQLWNTSGLVGYWTFDGNTIKSGRITNSVNTSEDGSPVNIATSTFYAPGHIGQGGNFDGTNDNVILPNSSTYNFDNTNNFTVAGWVNTNKTGAFQTIFSTVNSGGTGGFGFYLTTGRLVGLIVYTGAGASSVVTGNTAVTQNAWHHVAVVFTGPTTVNLYLDGVLDKTGSETQTLAGVSANRFIGKNNNLGDAFGGKIDDLRVYNRALSATEIQQLSISGFLNPMSIKNAPLSNGLVSYWNFDGYATRTGLILDQSGTNNGTLVNIATSTFYVPGRFGQALNFDGVDDRMTTSKAPGTTFTISAWVKPLAHPSAYGEVLTQNTTRGLYIKSDQRLTYFEGGDKQCTTLVKDNVWTHILVVANATYMTFWLNGVFCSALTFTVTAPTFTNTGSSNSSGEQFKGGIDDLRVYSTALSTTSIQQLYINGFINPNK